MFCVTLQSRKSVGWTSYHSTAISFQVVSLKCMGRKLENGAQHRYCQKCFSWLWLSSGFKNMPRCLWRNRNGFVPTHPSAGSTPDQYARAVWSILFWRVLTGSPSTRCEQVIAPVCWQMSAYTVRWTCNPSKRDTLVGVGGRILPARVLMPKPLPRNWMNHPHAIWRECFCDARALAINSRS